MPFNPSQFNMGMNPTSMYGGYPSKSLNQPWWEQFAETPDWARDFMLSRGGMGGGINQQNLGQWFPQFFGEMFGKLGAEDEAYRAGMGGTLRDIMGQTTGQMGATLGSQLSRTNVPVAGGANMVARRFMAPMQTQMQNYINQMQPMKFQDKVGSALGMAQQFYPMFAQHMEGKDYWNTVLKDFMKTLFGGK